MRRVLRLGGLLLLLIACAGVGALVAEHTNPFQPNVRDSGLSPSPTVSASPTPAGEIWTLSIKSTTWHRYVGGRCKSRWRGTAELIVDSQGSISGAGEARLVGRLVCEFRVAQIQARTLRLSITGSLIGGTFVLRIHLSASEPAGALDYGGFTGTLLRIRLTLAARAGSRKVHLRHKESIRHGSLVSNSVLTLAGPTTG